jgi:predicted GNAT family acetyltransferase
VHTFGCAGEAAFVDYADKGFQQFQIQHGGVPDSGFANDDHAFI